MQFSYRHCITIFLVIFCITAVYSVAEAKRFGGGRSLGRQSTSRSFTSMKPRPMPKQQTMERSSFFGGMGGIFTGLLAGTLLGSLLRGGAFSGIGLLDIIIFGAIIFFLFRMLRLTKEPSPQQSTSGMNYRNTENMWVHLEDHEEHETEYKPLPHEASGIENFDIPNFLKGAKILFNRMQDSWANRDLEDIKRFTTKTMFEEIAEQAKEDPTPSPITVIHLQAEVTGTQAIGKEEFADVLFNATLQEEEENTNITEIWRFARSQESDNSWKLDGITQL